MKKLLALLIAAALPLLATAADEPFAQGKDYVLVMQASPEKPDPKRVTVEEFFWYACPHCYALEPALEKWVAKLPKSVNFVRVPDTLGHDSGAWLVHAKAYYAAESMNVVDKMHRPLFDALHDDPRSLTTPESIAAFVGKTANVSPQAFLEALNSFFVDSEVRRAQQHGQDYGVTGTPTLVIDGHWLIAAKNPPEDMLKVADFLISKARKEGKKK